MRKISLVIFLALFAGNCLSAQVLLQTVTKRIEKSFPYKEGYEVNIEGEKAEVYVESWDRQEIAVLVEITAKNPEKAVAERDLAAMQYDLTKVKAKIYLRNYLSGDEKDPKPESLFDVVYTVKLPEACPVYIKNYFGETEVKNLVNRLRINSEFSKITLNNIRGVVGLDTRFGDLFGDYLDGQVNIFSRRSDLFLNHIRGSFDINAQYGAVRLFAEDDFLRLNVSADHSDVFFYHPNPQLLTYSLSSNQGKINTPSLLNAVMEADNPEFKKIHIKPSTGMAAAVTISVTFGDVTVEKARKPRP